MSTILEESSRLAGVDKGQNNASQDASEGPNAQRHESPCHLRACLLGIAAAESTIDLAEWEPLLVLGANILAIVGCQHHSTQDTTQEPRDPM